MSEELQTAYEQLNAAARDVLDLAEPYSDDEFILHEDCYKDLAAAHKAVYQAMKAARHAA